MDHFYSDGEYFVQNSYFLEAKWLKQKSAKDSFSIGPISVREFFHLNHSAFLKDQSFQIEIDIQTKIKTKKLFRRNFHKKQTSKRALIQSSVRTIVKKPEQKRSKMNEWFIFNRKTLPSVALTFDLIQKRKITRKNERYGYYTLLELRLFHTSGDSAVDSCISKER